MRTFDQVIDDFGPAFARIASSYERNAALQQDLLQEIMLALFRSLPQLKDSTKLRAFVFRVAHNCCVDHVARHIGRAQTADFPADLQSSEGTPEQHAIGREQTGRLVEAVRGLELPYRQVLTLLLEDMSYAEIADTLGISIDNVGVRVNRAKTQLKELLRHDR